MQALGSDDRENVELFLSCRNLSDLDTFSKSDPKVKVTYINKGKQVFLGETEFHKNDLNPIFKKTFIIDYIFEERQSLKFEVWDHDTTDGDDLIGSVESSLGSIVGAKNQVMILDLKSKNNQPRGKLIVRADKVKDSSQFIWWQWNGIKLMNVDGLFGKSDPFLRFYKKTDNGDWLMQFESEFLKDNLNPIWKPFEINIVKLCPKSYEDIFKVECWDNEKSGKHQFIGACELSMKQVLVDKVMSFALMNSIKKKKAGDLKISQCQINEKPTFIDYLRGGEQLNMMIAIDFTGSNGTPTNPVSLHYIRPDGGLNQYQSALVEVCDILLNYDFDKRVPVYGFGGKPNFPNYSKPVADHCFPLNGDPQQPEVYGLPGIMGAYAGALQYVSLSGPTYFEHILTNAIYIAKANEQNNVYSILMILTDGEIHDMGKTQNLIKEASGLPLSIIIVGVGNEQFLAMRKLDGDDNGTKISNRDLVQFVAFNDFKGNAAMLAKELLAELPAQLVSYKMGAGKKPNPPITLTQSQIKTD